jgi:hypothetical protein
MSPREPKNVDRQPWSPTSREKRARYPNFLHAVLDKTACAPFFKERRMRFADPLNFSGNRGYGAPPDSWSGQKLEQQVLTQTL